MPTPSPRARLARSGRVAALVFRFPRICRRSSSRRFLSVASYLVRRLQDVERVSRQRRSDLCNCKAPIEAVMPRVANASLARSEVAIRRSMSPAPWCAVHRTQLPRLRLPHKPAARSQDGDVLTTAGWGKEHEPLGFPDPFNEVEGAHRQVDVVRQKRKWTPREPHHQTCPADKNAKGI